MTELKSIASPAIHVEDRAHEADHPSSLVAKFGMDQPVDDVAARHQQAMHLLVDRIDLLAQLGQRGRSGGRL